MIQLHQRTAGKESLLACPNRQLGHVLCACLHGTHEQPRLKYVTIQPYL